jgi:hypothetical protein
MHHPRRISKLLAAEPNAVARSPVAQFSDSIGLPTDEGLFGFKPFAEMWTGRLAMMGTLYSSALLSPLR